MVDAKYRFRCSDVSDCDVIIYSEYRESVLEAARSHLEDVHDIRMSDEELERYIDTA